MRMQNSRLPRDASKHDLDEIRRLKTQNAEIQVQLAKARGAHGQVRVEKDNLVEKIGIVESDRDRYRSQLEELQSSFAAQATNTAAVESRNSELEEALSQALAGLKASDVSAQTYQERITELEKANRELTLQNQSLKSKVRVS
jgi:chromosome segregation ATPase